MSESDTPFPSSLPRCARRAPYAVEVEADKKIFWCTCGLSARQPYCDGAHKGTGFKPMVHPVEESGTAYLCGCKQTATPPYCDGSHSRIDPASVKEG